MGPGELGLHFQGAIENLQRPTVPSGEEVELAMVGQCLRHRVIGGARRRTARACWSPLGKFGWSMRSLLRCSVAAVDVGTGVAVNPGDSERPASDEPAGGVGSLVTAETAGGATVLVGDDGDAPEEGSRVAPGADADPASSPLQAAAVAANSSATGSSFPQMASRE